MLETVPAKLLDAYAQDENALVDRSEVVGRISVRAHARGGKRPDGAVRGRMAGTRKDDCALLRPWSHEHGCREKSFRRTGISGEKRCGRVSCVPRDTDCDGARIRIDKNKAHALR